MTNSFRHRDVTADNNVEYSHIYGKIRFVWLVSVCISRSGRVSLCFGYLDRMCSHYSQGFHWLGVDYI